MKKEPMSWARVVVSQRLPAWEATAATAAPAPRSRYGETDIPADVPQATIRKFRAMLAALPGRLRQEFTAKGGAEGEAA